VVSVDSCQQGANKAQLDAGGRIRRGRGTLISAGSSFWPGHFSFSFSFSYLQIFSSKPRLQLPANWQLTCLHNTLHVCLWGAIAHVSMCPCPCPAKGGGPGQGRRRRGGKVSKQSSGGLMDETCCWINFWLYALNFFLSVFHSDAFVFFACSQNIPQSIGFDFKIFFIEMSWLKIIPVN